MTFNELLEKIKIYYKKRGLKYPNSKDAAIFLTCEAAEVLDAYMRVETEWIRNNVNSTSLNDEIGDVLMMTLVLADSAGIDPVESLITKMNTKLQLLNP